MPQLIYLDYQATTPLAPEVFDAMEPWLKEHFGNPHSAHKMGRQSAAIVEMAREQVESLFPEDGSVIFTGSATEALNYAFGVALRQQEKGRDKIVVLETEHAAVRDTALSYRDMGFEVELCPVAADGIVSLDELKTMVDDNTAVVAAMLVNNEIGVIQPIEDIGKLARSNGALMICDSVQGYGRVPIPENVDLVAISGHKIYGPKGIGALWIRSGIDLPTLIHGGGQEKGLRSGTLSPALCAGLGMAAELCRENHDLDMAHVHKLAVKAKDCFKDWAINGSVDQRYQGNLNLHMVGVDVARLMSDVREVCFSAGSACASGSGRPSHVLSALNLRQEQVKSSIRLGYGRYTTTEEIEKAAGMINDAARLQLS